ncbi:MAG TPA: M1 family metallopeptidase [Gemmatimonadales bacterium]
MIALVLLALQQSPGRDAGSHWQQDVRYEISARLDEPAGVLAGGERIHYRNNSPDTLATFALHLHLNAFRPGSRWSDADSVEGLRRFNDLEDPDYGFNHVRDVRIMGEPVEPVYPFGPDSTIVRFRLPRPLLPGDTMTVEMEWDARPSTVPRRQARRGRRFDFAQWYPKVVVYDRYGWNERPLYPAGEFYGEFAAFTVDLDVPEDQVVGATGVPVCGDPGWERANRNRRRPVQYQRDVYGSSTPSSDVCGSAERGRKRIRWYAEKVHHFALSLNPEYRYEGGEFERTAVHVLYSPGDEKTWGGGIAVERTVRALAWLDRLFGPFGWPQLTNVHRIEGGGTEFPMMIMDGSADQGLIVHEAGHNYTMGLLANNEWREGWLDEGFTSFQTTWFWEAAGRPSTYPETEARVLLADLDRRSEPPSLPAEAYRDFDSYQQAIYVRGELFFHQLRYLVGDEVMHRILRTFYQRWRYRHVDETAFRSVAEEVSRLDLSGFFAQWLHGTELYDFGLGKVERERRGTLWVTQVEVVRHAPGRYPVAVAVIAEEDTAVARVEGLSDRESVELATRSKPIEVLLDPMVRGHDWNMLNNRRSLRFTLRSLLAPYPESEIYFHPYFSTRHRRDRMTVGFHPTLWYNDAGGVTLGVGEREDYLGRFLLNETLLSVATGWGSDEDLRDVDLDLRLRNPLFLRAPNASQTLDLFDVEGRYGATLALDWQRQRHPGRGALWSHGLSVQWVHPDDFRYLDRGYYDAVGTIEVAATTGVADTSGGWGLGLRGSLGGGLVYNRDGLAGTRPTEVDQFYSRATLEATAHRRLTPELAFGARFFAGGAGGDHEAVKQRQIYFQGADPLRLLRNPFLRSRGSLLADEDVRYHAPGGAGVRGADPRLSAGALAGLALELERTLLTRPRRELFSRVGVAGFADLSYALSATLAAFDEGGRFLADAGIGLRAEHRIGETSFVTRLDFPLWFNRPGLAHDRSPDDDELAFRWLVSFQPAF